MAHPDQTRDIQNRCGHRDRWKAPSSDVASAPKAGPHISSQTERRTASRHRERGGGARRASELGLLARVEHGPMRGDWRGGRLVPRHSGRWGKPRWPPVGVDSSGRIPQVGAVSDGVPREPFAVVDCGVDPPRLSPRARLPVRGRHRGLGQRPLTFSVRRGLRRFKHRLRLPRGDGKGASSLRRGLRLSDGTSAPRAAPRPR
jgi:hypothetical protein